MILVSEVRHVEFTDHLERHVLRCLRRYGNGLCEVWNKLKFTSVQELEDRRASWHRSCYKDAVHAGMLRRAREKYERQLEGPNECRRKSRPGSSEEIPQLTRSQTSPYNRNVCFFCDGPPGYCKNLHSISAFSPGVPQKLLGNSCIARFTKRNIRIIICEVGW